MTDLVADARQEIVRRLKQLAPVVAEYDRLLQADAALARLDAARAGKRRGRPPGKTTTTAKSAGVRRAKRGGGPGLRKGTGTRAAEALSLVQGQPGITVPEIAARMGIEQNYLYRVLPGLQKGGKVTKRGRGWHPK